MEDNFGKMPPLTQKSVHFWHFSIPLDLFDNSSLTAVLSEDEIQRGERFKFEKDRRVFLEGRSILRYLLSHYTGILPDKIRFHYNPFGRPFIANDVSCPITFNLSHTAGSIVLAFAENRALGIDIEKIHRFSGWKDIVNAFFLEEEKEYLYCLKPAEQLFCFFWIWTKKEALLKALGVGLGKGFERLSKTPLIGHKTSMCIAEQNFSSSIWVVKELALPKGYSGAIAYQGEDAVVLGSSQSSLIKTMSALRMGLFSST